MENISIRKAVLEEIPRLCALLKQLFELEADFEYDSEKHSCGFELLIKDKDAQIFVAVNKQNTVYGMCTLQKHISTSEGASVGILEDVVVDKTVRGTGIGKALLNEAAQYAVKRGYSRLQLVADNNNIGAHSFYKSAGWIQSNLSTWFYRIA